MTRLYSLLAILLFLGNTASAQWSREQIIVGGVEDGRELKPYDMDNDGDMDVLEVNSAAVGWHENYDGANNYIFHAIDFDDGFLNSSIEAADFDGDGDLDIVVGKEELIWYRNDDLSFTNSFVIEDSNIGFGHYDVAAHDFDNDGDMDILAHNLNIYFNNGQGVFQSVDIGPSDLEIEVKDINNDGALDIISVGSNEVNMYLNNGNATFAYEQIASYPNPYSWSIDVQDIDQDGHLDILIGFYETGDLRWYKNDGTASFTEQAILPTLSYNSQCKIFDVDGDGDLDFFLVKLSAPYIRWVEQEGNGTLNFLPEKTLFDLHSPGVCHIADMDNDNDLDILMTQTVGERNWLENTGSGLELRTFTPPLIGFQGWAESVSTTDLTGNGLQDLLYTGTGQTGLIHQTAEDIYEVKGELLFDETPGGANMSRFVDLNEDGEMEVVVASMSFFEGDGIKVYRQGPTDTLVFQQLVDSLIAEDLAYGDFDGDGDLDMVAAIKTENKLLWYANDGTGNFAAAQLIDTPSEPERIKVIDFNQDDQLDIALGLTNGQLLWYRNEVGDAFAAPQMIEDSIVDHGSFHARVSLDAADIDSDGDVDLLSNENRWYENLDGLGNFGPAIIVDENYQNPVEWNYPFSKVLLMDVDLDYDYDLVTHGEEMAIRYNDGTGQFSAPQTLGLISHDEQVYNIEMTDYDSDGDQDLLLLFRRNFRTSWLENEQVLNKEITLMVDSTYCNDNNTAADPSDDFYEIFYHVAAQALSPTYSLRVDGTTVQTGLPYVLAQKIEVAAADITMGTLELSVVDEEEDIFSSSSLLNTGGTCLLVATEDLNVQPAQFVLSPNPAASFAQLDLSLSQASTVAVQLRNSVGQVVQGSSTRRNFPAGNHRLELPVASLPAGLYFVEIQLAGKVHTVKLMVE